MYLCTYLEWGLYNCDKKPNSVFSTSKYYSFLSSSPFPSSFLFAPYSPSSPLPPPPPPSAPLPSTPSHHHHTTALYYMYIDILSYLNRP